jgi:hypothetical protein
MEMAARAPLIDHAVRRRAFADLCEVPEELWDSICQGAGLRRTRSGGRRRYSAAWIWAELTCGDPHRSPALRGVTPAVRQGWARFAARGLSRLEPCWASPLATCSQAIVEHPLAALDRVVDPP